jgi:hypothetical protein
VTGSRGKVREMAVCLGYAASVGEIGCSEPSAARRRDTGQVVDNTWPACGKSATQVTWPNLALQDSDFSADLCGSEPGDRVPNNGKSK